MRTLAAQHLTVNDESFSTLSMLKFSLNHHVVKDMFQNAAHVNDIHIVGPCTSVREYEQLMLKIETSSVIDRIFEDEDAIIPLVSCSPPISRRAIIINASGVHSMTVCRIALI